MRESDPDNYYAAYGAAKQTHLDYLLATIAWTPSPWLVKLGKGFVVVFQHSVWQGLGRIKPYGGQNCHLDLEFGVIWIVRLRRCDPLLPPQPVQDYIFLSEVATEFLE